MFRKVDHKNMGRANHGWLNTHFHFSFANYYNPNNMNFGALRVINDDLVAPQTGFDMHPHRDETLRILQIWILPDREDHKPNYGEFTFDWNKRENEWFHMVSQVEGGAPIQIHQDANLYS